MGRYQGGQAARESSLSRAWRPRRVGSAATPPGVVSLSDLTYLGCCWVPKAKSGAGLLTGHYVGGELRLISLDPTTNGVEFTVPGMLSSDATNAPRGVQTRATWTAPGGTHYLVCQRSPVVDTSVLVAPGSAGAPTTVCGTSGGFLAPDGAVYVSYMDLYNSTGIPDPNLLRLELGDGGTWTASGPWKIGTTKRNNQYFVPLTGDVSTACGGATWANGAVGIQSGNAGSSWGPSLFAFAGDLPTASTPPYPTTASRAWTYTLANFDYTHPAPRPTDTTGMHGNVIGQWSQIDCSQCGTSVWIETATKAGWFVAGMLGGGCIWYSSDYNHDGKIDCYDGSPEPWTTLEPGHPATVWDDTKNGITGPHAGYYYNYCWVYDPADLAKVARGQMNGWDLRPVSEGPFPGSPYFGTQVGLPPLAIRASWFDAVTDRLYLATEALEWTWDPSPYQLRPIIHVYQVS